MGCKFCKCCCCKKPKAVSVLTVGLDNSGKTTMITRMRTPVGEDSEMDDIVPTPGFQVERYRKGKFSYTVYDMSGMSKYRKLVCMAACNEKRILCVLSYLAILFFAWQWHVYYKEVKAVLYVIDCADTDRLDEARQQLLELLNHEDIRDRAGLPVLVMANKMDLPTAIGQFHAAGIMYASSPRCHFVFCRCGEHGRNVEIIG